jgi:phosphoglycolate phosphatase-like HAD superfamily hydrolase
MLAIELETGLEGEQRSIDEYVSRVGVKDRADGRVTRSNDGERTTVPLSIAEACEQIGADKGLEYFE